MNHSWEPTWPPPRHFWIIFVVFPWWDMSVPWRVRFPATKPTTPRHRDTEISTKVTERIQSEALGPVVQVSKVTIAPRTVKKKKRGETWRISKRKRSISEENFLGIFWLTPTWTYSFGDVPCIRPCGWFWTDCQPTKATISNFDTGSFPKNKLRHYDGKCPKDLERSPFHVWSHERDALSCLLVITSIQRGFHCYNGPMKKTRKSHASGLIWPARKAAAGKAPSLLVYWFTYIYIYVTCYVLF